MKAVIHCGGQPAWAVTLGDAVWSLLPVGNRPLLEYWLELCAELKIDEVRLVLGHGAEFVEAYAGAGERWGLAISYSFLKDDQPPAAFLRRAPELWRAGLLFVGAPAFPRRVPDRFAWPAHPPPAMVARAAGGPLQCLWAAAGAALDHFCASGQLPGDFGAAWAAVGLEIQPIGSVRDYYELNMRLVRGEITRYLAPGYYAADGAYIGYNVIIPPAAQVQPPLMVGNDSRLAPLCAVGPDAILGARVVADRQCLLTRCVVLDGTYIGPGVEIDGKIVAGRRVVDPESGAVADIVDPWLLAPLRAAGHLRDAARAILGWPVALLLALLLVSPFALLYPLARRGGGHFVRRPARGTRGLTLEFPEWRAPPTSTAGTRWFTALGLDLLPRLGLVLIGRLWLCGQPPLRSPAEDDLLGELPHYHPGAVSYADLRTAHPAPGQREIEARYYAHQHSPGTDAQILLRFFWRRWFGALTDYAAAQPGPEALRP